jgi:hypothetical protein
MPCLLLATVVATAASKALGGESVYETELRPGATSCEEPVLQPITPRRRKRIIPLIEVDAESSDVHLDAAALMLTLRHGGTPNGDSVAPRAFCESRRLGPVQKQVVQRV